MPKASRGWMNKMKKLLQYYHTIRYLKLGQISFQFIFRFKAQVLKYKSLRSHYQFKTRPVRGVYFNFQHKSYFKTPSGHSFSFLGKTIGFSKEINWEYNASGKLWTYHLNYFDFLRQRDIEPEQGLFLIKSYSQNREDLKTCYEPYTISKRGINWIVFLSKNEITDNDLEQFLFHQYLRLYLNPEYHIMGNHLLENGFSLLFGAYFFNESRFYKRSKKIIIDQLEEQILQDGGHYERSPMYQQIVLLGLLDCLNLIKNNTTFQDQAFENMLLKKAGSMLAWINNFTFKNGSVPMVNDAAPGIAPTTEQLNCYATSIEIHPKEGLRMGGTQTGYRLFNLQTPSKLAEIFIDVGDIGPDHQPGHAHSDTFNLILNINRTPVLVDTGISTYDRNPRRLLERSTESHNTVKYGNLEQSEVWSSFRVARRAKVRTLIEDEGFVSASHDGYSRVGISHQRSFEMANDHIMIQDKMVGKILKISTMFLHFHPEIKPKLEDDLLVCDYCEIKFRGYKAITLEEYQYAEGFNSLKPAVVLIATFDRESSFQIML